MEVRCELWYDFDFLSTKWLRFGAVQNDKIISSTASAAAVVDAQAHRRPLRFFKEFFFSLLFTFINLSDPNISAEHESTRFCAELR